MVYTIRVEIKHCKRCGCDWCFRGFGRPLRCGKCKTPYWDVEVGDAGIRDGVGRVDSGGGQDNRAVGEGLRKLEIGTGYMVHSSTVRGKNSGPRVGAAGDGANGKGIQKDARDCGFDVAGSSESVGYSGRVAQLAEHSARPAHAVGCKCGMCKILATNKS